MKENVELFFFSKILSPFHPHSSSAWVPQRWNKSKQTVLWPDMSEI